MGMKSIAKKPEPGSGFDSHLLNMEETWWIRDHPFNKRSIAVKNLIKQVTEAEDRLEAMRVELDTAVAVLNEERMSRGS